MPPFFFTLQAQKRASLHKDRFAAPTGPVAKTLGDATMARNKAKRQASKHNIEAPKPALATVSEPVREAEFDPQAQYLVTSKHLATMKRPVGSKKLLFRQMEEEAMEEAQGLQGGLQPTIYAEILTWSFYNRKSGEEFIKLMEEIAEQGLCAEGYFNIFELPVNIEAVSVPEELRQDRAHGTYTIKTNMSTTGNNYVPAHGDVRYMSVAVGTTEQFVNLHRSMDIRLIMNSGITKQLEKQRGIKHVSGIYQCAKGGQTKASSIVDEWNLEAYVSIEASVNRKLGVPGGCPTVTWFAGGGDADVGGSGDDLLLTVGTHTCDAGVENTEDAFNWFDIVRGEYKKVSIPLSQNALFNGVCSPIDYSHEHPKERAQPLRFTTFSMQRASNWLAAKKNAGSDDRAEMAGISNRKVFYFGAGAHKPEMKEYVSSLQGIQGMQAAILSGAVFIESPEEAAHVLGARTEAAIWAKEAAAQEAADAEAAEKAAAAVAAQQKREDARAAALAAPPSAVFSLSAKARADAAKAAAAAEAKENAAAAEAAAKKLAEEKANKVAMQAKIAAAAAAAPAKKRPSIFAKKEKVLLGHVNVGIEIKPALEGFVLTVQVIEGKGLRAEDTNGLSDPFVKLNISGDKKKEKKTKTIKKSLNPEWNETLTIDGISVQQIAEQRLELSVWDWDRVSGSDFMGGCSWSLQELNVAEKLNDWFTLFETDNATTMNLVATQEDKVTFGLPSAAEKAKAKADATRQAAESLAAASLAAEEAAAAAAAKAARKAERKAAKKASKKKAAGAAAK